MPERSRAEHIAWCKERALEYLNHGDLTNAVASMTSDMGKHPETRSAIGMLAMMGMAEVMNNNAAGVRAWIQGF